MCTALFFSKLNLLLFTTSSQYFSSLLISHWWHFAFGGCKCPFRALSCPSTLYGRIPFILIVTVSRRTKVGFLKDGTSCERVTGISIDSIDQFPNFFPLGNRSSYCNLALDGVHHRQMHLYEFWHFFPCTLSTEACMGVRPCLFSFPSPHTHHLPLQGKSSSLTQLMGATGRLMTSTWRELVTPLLHSLLCPTLFVCGN